MTIARVLYFTGVSIGGYALPTILAGIVDATSAEAGFIGLAVLFLIAAAIWIGIRTDKAHPQSPG